MMPDFCCLMMAAIAMIFHGRFLFFLTIITDGKPLLIIILAELCSSSQYTLVSSIFFWSLFNNFLYISVQLLIFFLLKLFFHINIVDFLEDG